MSRLIKVNFFKKIKKIKITSFKKLKKSIDFDRID
jgi:hypothetical protein